MSNADELKKLKELLDSKVISQEEFNKEKSKILENEAGQTIPSTDGIENKLDSKSDKKTKSKKWYIIAGVFLVLYMIGSVGGDTSGTSSTSSSSSGNSSSSSNSSSTCEYWSNQTANNALKMSDTMEKIADDATDASVGVISISTFESYLQSDLRKAKNIYNNQISLSPNSANVTTHNYFLDALEDLIDGIDLSILGIQQNDADYIELGIIYIDSAGDNASLASSSLSSC